MEKIIVDNGQKFDFGKTSKEYAKYRDIYPEELFARLHELGIGRKGSRFHLPMGVLLCLNGNCTYNCHKGMDIPSQIFIAPLIHPTKQ